MGAFKSAKLFLFQDNDLLPITNDDNYFAALRNARPLLRLVIQREGEFYDDHARAKSGTILGTFLGRSGTILGTFLGRSGTTLGTFLGRSGTILGTILGRSGTTQIPR